MSKGGSAEDAGFPSRVPLRGCDSFLLALDTMMRRKGQGEHLGQTLLELGAGFDLEGFQRSARALTEKYPILIAPLRRGMWTGPYWEAPPRVERGIPVGVWREPGSPGVLGKAALEIDSWETLLHRVLNTPLSEGKEANNLRFDIVERRDGTFLLAATWTHLLFDGIGAELLLMELARLHATGSGRPGPGVAKPVVLGPWKETAARSKAFVQRFSKLVQTRFHSLGGPDPKPGRASYLAVALNARDTAAVKARADRLSGPLLPMPFFLACATRAHARVLAERGVSPPSFVISLPVQTRRKGGAAAIFQNQVSILFFQFLPEDLSSLEGAAQAAQNQFCDMMRRRLDDSFGVVLHLMRRIPSWLYMQFLRRQFRGELTCFFHSHTGLFAPELREICGAKIGNAFHAPTVSTPPGTGLFLSERDGLLTITLSWREQAATAKERELLLSGFLAELLGRPREGLAEALAEAR